MEDVHDHLQVIEHHPLTGRKTVKGRRLGRMFLAQPVFNLAGDGLEMRFGRSRTNDEKVREGRDFAQIQNDDFFRLFAGGKFGAD